MTNARRFLALLLCVAMASAGCASYTAKPAPTGSLGSMPTSRIEGPLALGIDPYLEVERQRAVFDEKLTDKRILAIQINAENRGTGALAIPRGDMVLELPDGQQLVPVDGAKAADKFSGDLGNVIGWAVLGLVPALIAMYVQSQADQARIADYRAKEFDDGTVQTGIRVLHRRKQEDAVLGLNARGAVRRYRGW